MSNKLPEKYQNHFFVKIKRFFINIFKKKNIETEKKETKSEINNKIRFEENEFDKMKAGSKKVTLKEDILDAIEENPELVESLSVERLMQLESMYDKVIEENDRKLKRLKREIV